MRDFLSAIRQLERDARLTIFVSAMIGFGYFGIQGVLINLYLLRLGYGAEFIGLLNGSGQLVWALFALPSGALGARIGLQKAVVLGQVATGLGSALIIAAGFLPAEMRSTGLILSWMVLWIGASLTSVNSLPYLMATTTLENRGYAFSIQQAVMALMAFAGSIVAGFLPGLLAGGLGLALSQPAPYRLALLLAPLSFLASTLVFSRARSVQLTSAAGSAQPGAAAPLGIFLFFSIATVLQAFGDGAARAFFNVYLDTELASPTARIGAVMGIAQLLPVAAAMLTPGLLARRGAHGAQVLGASASAFFLAVLAALPFWTAASVGYMGMIGTAAITATARSIFSQEIVEPRWRTTTAALATIGLALGWSSASAGGGLLVAWAGFRGIFLLGSLSALLSAALLVLYARSQRAQAAAPVQPVPVMSEGGGCDE